MTCPLGSLIRRPNSELSAGRCVVRTKTPPLEMLIAYSRAKSASLSNSTCRLTSKRGAWRASGPVWRGRAGDGFTVGTSTRPAASFPRCSARGRLHSLKLPQARFDPWAGVRYWALKASRLSSGIRSSSMKRPPHLVLLISSWVSVAREYAEKSTVKCKHAIEGNWMTARFDTAEGSRWSPGFQSPAGRLALRPFHPRGLPGRKSDSPRVDSTASLGAFPALRSESDNMYYVN